MSGRRKALAVVVVVVLAVVALWLRRDSGALSRSVASDDAVTGSQPAADGRVRTGRQSSVAGQDTEGTPSAEALLVPPGSIAYRHVSLDDVRAEHDLPPISPELNALHKFPPESAEDRADPTRHALYQVHRKIHQSGIIAEHEQLESSRFARDAERATDPERQQQLQQAAEQHADVAHRTRESRQRLLQKRQQLIADLARTESEAEATEGTD